MTSTPPASQVNPTGPENPTGIATLRWIVTGRVQGVSYRYFTRRAATELGLAGWVRNLPDGSVEAQLRGPAEKIDQLRTQLRQGPPASRVDAISEEDLPASTELPERFEIRF